MKTCGASLTHAHGVDHCDLPAGHGPQEQHSALCGHCLDLAPDYGDPSDRLRWDRDGESWVGGGSRGA